VPPSTSSPSDPDGAESADELAAESTSATASRRATTARGRKRSTKASVQRWARILHAYSSMICLLLVLFFSVTGLTLNHPNWTLGGHTNQAKEAGTLPATSVIGTTVDWLAVAEYLRSTYSLRGEVSDHQASGGLGTITFKGPGYLAAGSFQLDTRAYQLDIETQGYVGVLNDLHKGRDTRSSWKWLIDVSAIILVFISLSGFVLQLVLKARRRSALVGAVGGTLVLGLFAYVAVR
jgi:hypothetical protein